MLRDDIAAGAKPSTRVSLACHTIVGSLCAICTRRRQQDVDIRGTPTAMKISAAELRAQAMSEENLRIAVRTLKECGFVIIEDVVSPD